MEPSLCSLHSPSPGWSQLAPAGPGCSLFPALAQAVPSAQNFLYTPIFACLPFVTLPPKKRILGGCLPWSLPCSPELRIAPGVQSGSHPDWVKTGSHLHKGSQSGAARSSALGTSLACASVSMIFKDLEPTKLSPRHQNGQPSSLHRWEN